MVSTISISEESMSAVLDLILVVEPGVSMSELPTFSSAAAYADLVSDVYKKHLPELVRIRQQYLQVAGSPLAHGRPAMSDEISQLATPAYKLDIFKTLVEFWFPIRPQVSHRYIRVAPSKISGQGVFATKTIPPNTTVSCYPMHAVSIGLSGFDEQCTWIVSRDPKTYGSGQLAEHEQRPFAEHWHNLRTKHGTIAFAASPDIHTPDACAHMCNGADCPETDGAQTAEPNAALDWYVPGIPVMVLVTGEKPVEAGQEILVNYGSEYWVKRSEALRQNLEPEPEPEACMGM